MDGGSSLSRLTLCSQDGATVVQSCDFGQANIARFERSHLLVAQAPAWAATKLVEVKRDEDRPTIAASNRLQVPTIAFPRLVLYLCKLVFQRQARCKLASRAVDPWSNHQR